MKPKTDNIRLWIRITIEKWKYRVNKWEILRHNLMRSRMMNVMIYWSKCNYLRSRKKSYCQIKKKEVKWMRNKWRNKWAIKNQKSNLTFHKDLKLTMDNNLPTMIDFYLFYINLSIESILLFNLFIIDYCIKLSYSGISDIVSLFNHLVFNLIFAGSHLFFFIILRQLIILI
jgi:hypothetical protein